MKNGGWRFFVQTAAATIFLAQAATANNLSITNVSLVNVAGGEADIQFDVSWDHSWRASWTDNGGTVTVTNWDAVWVFVKYRQSGQLWHHVMPTTNGHTATGGTTVTVPDDGNGNRLGAFVHRTAEGSGSTTCTAMRLHWNYAASGLAGTNEMDLAVLGIEMAYIPEGAFSLGSGGTESRHFYRYPDEATSFVVTNEGAITVGSETGNLYYSDGGDYVSILAAFPKGYRSFYCMKYEITEGQYVDFLNLLDPGIAASYYPDRSGQNRHTIHTDSGVYTSDAPTRACGWLHGSWILTYMDWCGLRPMTELEFEKACRGVRTPWINEYPWGNTTAISQTGHDGTDGSGTETATPTNANTSCCNEMGGPVRVGIYAKETSSRQDAGAGYYGNMNLGGNLAEMAISAGRAHGQNFQDIYGDGNEYTSWTALWPAVSSTAYILRGGNWSWGTAVSCVSDRTYTGWDAPYNGSQPHYGARGVRTAP